MNFFYKGFKKEKETKLASDYHFISDNERIEQIRNRMSNNNFIKKENKENINEFNDVQKKINGMKNININK